MRDTEGEAKKPTLSKEQAAVAAEAVLGPKRAEAAAEAARTAARRQRLWFFGWLGKQQLVGEWTVALGIAGFTIGLLAGVLVWDAEWAGAGIGAVAGALIGYACDRAQRH